MNQDTNFSFNEKKTEGNSQNSQNTAYTITPIQKHRNGSPGTSTSNNLSPKEKFGIESIKEPLSIESGASCLHLKMGNESLNTNRHIDNGLEPKEDCETPVDYYDNCNSSSMTDDDQVEEIHPDDNSNQKITSTRKGSCDERIWVKIELLRDTAQNLVNFVGEKLEENKEPLSDMEKQLLAAKNMIEDQLRIDDGKCDGKTGEGLDLYAESDEENSVFEGDSASFLREIIGTSPKPNRIIQDYEESLNLRFGNGDSIKLFNEMINTCMDLSDMVLEYQEGLNTRFGNRAEIIRGLMDTSLYLREIVSDYEKSLNPRFGAEDGTKLLHNIIHTSRAVDRN